MKVRGLFVLLVMLGLSACGGGGAGSEVVAATSSNGAVVPIVTTVSSNNIAVNGSLLVTGSNLDRVTAFQLGGATLASSALSATSVTLAMPATPVSGTLTLVSAGGSVTSGYRLAVYVPLTVGEVTPDTGGVGTSVTIHGNGMANVTAVLFANGVAAALQGHTDGEATFLVPVGATSGQLTVRGAYDEALSSAAFTVLPSVSVTSISSAISGGTLSVTVFGSNLDQVSDASIGSTSASIVSASTSELRLSAPGTATGNLMLSAPSRVAVNAGAVAAFTLGSIDFAQVFNLNASDTALRLTRGKAAAVRVSVLGTQAGRASPVVTLAATAANGASLGSILLSGPAILPTSKNDYSFDGNFSAALPADWVQPGLQVRVTAADEHGPQVSQQAAPAVSLAAKIHLVLVPLSTSDGVSMLPDPEVIRAALVRVYPYAAGDISITARAPLSVPGSSGADGWWTDTLPVLEAVRSQEDRNAFYYGFASKPSASRTAGLAYISDRASGRAYPSALGLDATWQRAASVDAFGNSWPEWLTTLIHELGHNHALLHVACGAPANTALDYPYANGELGPQPLYNSNYGGGIGQLGRASYIDRGASQQMKDVMGYCSGAWFSDYSYARVQQFLENRNALSLRSGTLAASVVAAENGYLTISGRITPAGVQLYPAVASAAAPGPAAGGVQAYSLRIVTASGQVMNVPLETMQLADSRSDVRHFRASFANPGDISDVEVLVQGKPLNRVRQASTRRTAVAGAVTFDARQGGGKLALAWDAQTEPYAAVLHVAADGRKTVVASGLTGGSADVDVSALPAGGYYEISLSSSVRGRLVKVARR